MKNRIILLLLLSLCELVRSEIYFEFEKDNSLYPDYVVPKEEEAFTKDVRRVSLEGELLTTPVVVEPDGTASLGDRFGPVSRFLELSRKGDIELVLELFTEESKDFVLSQSSEAIANIASVNKRTDRYEIHLITEREGGHVVAYGYQFLDGEPIPARLRVKLTENNEFKMEGGLPAYSMGYDSNLMRLIVEEGFDAIRVRD